MGIFPQGCGGLGFALVLATAGGTVPARACTVPVFRYALDRWEPDAYRLVVDASWAATPDGLRLLAPLRGNGPANLAVEEREGAGARLEFPEGEGPVALWNGVLDADSLGRLLESPARAELVRRLIRGDSVVWVAVAGSDPEDQAATERLEERLRFLEQVGSLPEQDPTDPESRLGPGPELALRFSLLRMTADDPEEALFRRLLAGPGGEEGAAEGAGFAAAVFGRGRVLGAWPLASLEDALIEDVSLFLIGRCSCRVKQENPGWDLLLRADWERELEAADMVEDPVPEPTAAPGPVTITTAVAAPEAARRERAWRAWAGLGLVAVLGWAGWKIWRPR